MTVRTAASAELTRPREELTQLFRSLRSRRDVAELLEVPYGHLIYMLYQAPERYPYRTFAIPKRSGGMRQIAAPHPSLRILQSKLNTVLQLVYPGKPPVHGFVSDRSILSNAMRHKGKRFVLNIDLEDFFPSINFGRVRGMFMAQPYRLEEAAATTLAQICCHDNQLPQGAPTSPMVANMLCAKLDSQLQRLARDHKCAYTRYADDLTFSTTVSRFPEQLAACERGWVGPALALGDDLLSLIESNGFRVNTRKQRLQYRTWRQEVTGLTVNRFPNVRRRFIRQIRAMLHAWEKYGLEAAQQEFDGLYDRRCRRPDGEGPSFGRVVRGKLDFVRMVRGEGDLTYRKLANKLHRLDPSLIDDYPEAPPAYSDQAALRDKTWDDVYQRCQGLVFLVEIRRPDGRVSCGTAFAWGRKALATAAHNIEGEVHITPPMPEGLPASDFVFHDRVREGVDAAVIRLRGVTLPGMAHPPVRHQLPTPGEQIAVLGYRSIPRREAALGICTGIVESIAPSYGATFETIQVSAEISGGMSGGPAVDRGGNLVGIAMETTFEQTAENVPGRAFYHILPVRYLLDIHLEDAVSSD